MFRRVISTSCVAMLAAVTCGSVSQADDEVTDLYFQQVLDRYYNFPSTARVVGMGGSTYLTSTDSSAVVGNPAGLGFMRMGEISGTYRHDTVSGDEFPTGHPVEQNTDSGSGNLALPISPTLDLPEFGNFGLGWTGAEGKWDDDTFNTETKQTQITAAYAKAISDTWSLGYSVGWTKDKLQSNDVFNYPMANGWRHNLGAMHVVDDALSYGFNVLVGHGTHHALFGPGIKEKSDTLQFGAGLGAQYRVDQTLFALSGDYSHLKTEGDVRESIPENFIGGDEKGNMFNIRLGVEQSLGENFALRAGYRFAGLADYDYSRSELTGLEGSAYYNAVSFGAGASLETGWYHVPKLQLDYGVEYRAVGDDDWQHVVTLSAPIELCAPV